jgi:hypothetical protein
LGLRLVGSIGDAATRESALSAGRRGQFSLATALLAISIAGVHLGLVRAAGIDRDAAFVLLVVLVLSLPGCLLLTISSLSPPAKVRCIAIIGLYYLALLMLLEFGFELLFVRAAGVVLTVQLLIVGVTMVILQIAGVRLLKQGAASPTIADAPQESATAPLSCARGT